MGTDRMRKLSGSFGGNIRLGLIALVATAGALSWSTSHAIDVSIVPACPRPEMPISIVAVSKSVSPPVILPHDAQVTVSGDVVKIVVDASRTAFLSPQSKIIGLAGFAPGEYRVDFFHRYLTGTGAYEPEVLDASLNLHIEVSPANVACAPSMLTIAKGAHQGALVNSPFAEPLEVIVTDGQLRTVSNATVTFKKIARPEDRFLPPAQQADAVMSSATVLTDAAGVARVFLSANAVAGTYQIAATIGSSILPSAYFVLSNRTDNSSLPESSVPAVEFYNAARDHYFIATSLVESRQLDIGMAQGWARTGAVFLVGTDDSIDTTLQPVCRFYGRPEAGLDSHFYSASLPECSEVRQKFSQSWILESDNAFRGMLPDLASGQCIPKLLDRRPLYRVYNNRSDTNHRYSLSQDVINEMRLNGWIPEGYGTSGTTMCVFQ